MRRTWAVAAIALAATGAWAAEEYGTAKEAEAMVGRAVAAIKTSGAPKAYAAFTARESLRQPCRFAYRRQQKEFRLRG